MSERISRHYFLKKKKNGVSKGKVYVRRIFFFKFTTIPRSLIFISPNILFHNCEFHCLLRNILIL